MTITAKLFKGGRNQSIRVPTKLELNAKEARIEQIGISLCVLLQPPMGQEMTELGGQLLLIEQMPARELPVRSSRCPASTARSVSMRRTSDTGICRYILRRHPAPLVADCRAFSGSSFARPRWWLRSFVSSPVRFRPFCCTGRNAARPLRRETVASRSVVEICACACCAGACDDSIATMDSMIAAHSMTEDSMMVANSARGLLRIPALAAEGRLL